MIVFVMLAKLTQKTARIIFIFTLTSFYSISFANENLEIEIDNPKFSEKGLDNRLYEIKADRGIQKANSLELFTVEGKLRTDKGVWIYLNAERGNFNQLDNLIELSGKINFYTDENDKFYSDYALFYIDNDLFKFNENVKHIKGNNTIASDKSRMKNNFEHVIYEGNVSTLYMID